MKKVIVIVGVGSGISLSVAHRFGQEGYAVAVPTAAAPGLTVTILP